MTECRGAGGGGGVGGLEMIEELDIGLGDTEGEDSGGSEDIARLTPGSETSRTLIIYSSNLTDQTRAKFKVAQMYSRVYNICTF